MPCNILITYTNLLANSRVGNGEVRVKIKKKLKKLDTQSRWHRVHIIPPPQLLPLATHMSANRSSILKTLWSIKRLHVKELLLVIQQAVRLENVAFQHRVVDLYLQQIILQTSPSVNI